MATDGAIAAVEAFAVRAPLPEPRGSALGFASAYEALLVRVVDEDGAAGWGETELRPGQLGLVARLAELLVGEPALDRRRLWLRLRAATADTWALGALAIALDDLAARRLGVPVSALYGGAIRADVQVYAASAGYRPDEGPERYWLDEAEALAARGFSALKLRIGRYAWEHELRLLERVRAALPSVSLVADAAGTYQPETALEVGRALEELGFAWFEEPTAQLPDGAPPYDGYDAVASALSIPIAGGEVLENRRDFHELISRRAVDLVQPDATLCGGIAEAFAVAELAALAGIPTVPHSCNTALGLAATAQLVAALPSVAGFEPLLEYDACEPALLTDLLVEPLPIEGGRLAVPTAPGLGVEVDERIVRRLRLEGAT